MQQFQEQNIELEAELENMEAEMEKMQVYEKSYHTQEKKLATSLDRMDALDNEKNNIEVAHNDLLQEFTVLRQEKDKLVIDNNTFRVETDELRNQLTHLKMTVIKQFDEPTTKIEAN